MWENDRILCKLNKIIFENFQASINLCQWDGSPET